MNTIAEYMAKDHRRCDELFAVAEQVVADGDWSVVERSFTDFHQAMEHHFAMEEEVLFPDFERESGNTMGPTRVMRLEHQQMRELFADMGQAVAAKEAERFLGDAETLLILMQQHNAKEEQILYPMTDQMLAAQRDEVLARMQAITEA